MAQKQQSKSGLIQRAQKEDRTPFVPAIDLSAFWKVMVTTFVIGFIGFLILFFYIATH